MMTDIKTEKLFGHVFCQIKIWYFFYFRKRIDVYNMISKIINKAGKFETHTKTKIQEKLEPFLEVCNISKVISPAVAEQTTPLSPKRPESPTGK